MDIATTEMLSARKRHDLVGLLYYCIFIDIIVLVLLLYNNLFFNFFGDHNKSED